MQRVRGYTGLEIRLGIPAKGITNLLIQPPLDYLIDKQITNNKLVEAA